MIELKDFEKRIVTVLAVNRKQNKVNKSAKANFIRFPWESDHRELLKEIPSWSGTYHYSLKKSGPFKKYPGKYRKHFQG